MNMGLRGQPSCPGERRPACLPLLWRLCLVLAVVATAGVVPSQSSAAPPHPTQADVEAVYLYNFGKFIRWPSADAQKPLIICVLGQDALEKDLENVVANEHIGGRSLQARRLAATDPPGACSILFLGAAETPHPSARLAALKGLPIVTVSDAPGFLDQGGMIQFVLMDGRVRFAVNLDPAARAGLAFSSQLLKVASSVIGSSQPGGAQ